MNFSCWKCADDHCLGTMVSLLIGLLYASLQLPLDNRENKNSWNVWAKFAKISSCENFYLYSIQEIFQISLFNKVGLLLTLFMPSHFGIKASVRWQGVTAVCIAHLCKGGARVNCKRGKGTSGSRVQSTLAGVLGTESLGGACGVRRQNTLKLMPF